MKNWWIGCSGFYYKHWRSAFYPEGLPMKKWFEYYCQFFNTVEINVTFYRFPKLTDLQGWYDRSPESFRFTVKAPRLITHYKKFKDAARETNDFYHVVQDGLADKLGPVLFQLHPRFQYSAENLARTLDCMNDSFTNVIEFRHPSWWNDDTFKSLKQHNVSFCGISHPSLPDDVIKTASAMYYRFHGVPDLYRSPYSSEELQAVVKGIKSFRGVSEVYVYFNNDIDVSAVANAREVQAMVSHPRKSSLHTHDR